MRGRSASSPFHDAWYGGLMRRRFVVPLVGLLAFADAPARADRADDVQRVTRLSLDAARGIVPQPTRASDAFRRARPFRGETFEGTLFCEVRVDGDDWDGIDPLGPVRRNLGRAELDAEVVLPRRDDRVRFVGPDDQNRVVFAVPGVRLEAEDRVHVDVVDRDVFTNDAIGAFDLVYQGELPLEASGERAGLVCRGVPASALARAIDDAIDDVDDAIEELARTFVPDESLVGFRTDEGDPTEAWLALYDLARLVGLSDERFLMRRDDLRAREAAYVVAARALVERLATNAAPTDVYRELEGTGLALRIDAYDCKLGDVLDLHPALGLDVPMTCAVYASVRNEGARDVTLGATFHVVDELGLTSPLPRAAAADADTGEFTRLRTLRFAPGETRIVLAAPTRHGVLIRVGRRRTIDWFRTGEPREDESGASGLTPGPARAP